MYTLFYSIIRYINTYIIYTYNNKKGGDIMFINISNHPASHWGNEQLVVSLKMGNCNEVTNYPFPAVPEDGDESVVDNLAEKVINDLRNLGVKAGDVAMIQGEYTLVFRLVTSLKQLGVRCVAGCSKRNTIEEHLPDGTTVKKAFFVFCRYRDY